MSVIKPVDNPDATEWTQVYNENSVRITQHPRFAALVREVAIEEQPGHRWGYRRPSQMRSQRLALQIAEDLDVLPDLPDGERAARVYVEARDHVRNRLNGRPEVQGD